MKPLMLKNRSVEYEEHEVNLGVVDLVDDETDCFLCLRCERCFCFCCCFCCCCYFFVVVVVMTAVFLIYEFSGVYIDEGTTTW
jgi:hypothetical protein